MPRLILCADPQYPDLRLNTGSSDNAMIWENTTLMGTKENDVSHLKFLCETLLAGSMTDYAMNGTGRPVILEPFKL